MSGHYKTLSAVMLILIRERDGQTEILLQKRQNTGYMDGMWDCAASGHVEADESMKQALIREAMEELNISIAINDVRFATMTHKYAPETKTAYYNAFFVVGKFSGAPQINEPEKCSQLQWFNLNDLPGNLIVDRKEAIQNYIQGIPYDECGWQNPLAF